MATLPPRPSKPPLTPEAERDAHARLGWLRAELDHERKRDRRASLRYEIGGIYERTLRDDPSAVQEYLASYNSDPSFRPPLFALMRIFERRRSYRNLAKLYEAAATAARSPSDLAGALLDRAALLEDQLEQPLDARTTIRQALHDCPTSVVASLWLEYAGRTHGDAATVERAIEARLEQTTDAGLRALLLAELAEFEERNGNVDRALSLLTEAGSLGRWSWRIWERLERVAHGHGRHAEVIAALEGRAILASSTDESGASEAQLRFATPRDARREAAVLWYEAGRLREALGDVRGAVTCLSNAVDCDSDDALFRLSQMAISDISGELAMGAHAARNMLDRGVTGPWAAALHGQLARFLLADGSIDPAVQAIRTALQEDPNSAAAHALLESTLEIHGRHTEVFRLLEQRANQLEGAARTEVLWHAADVAVHALGDHDRGLELYEAALLHTEEPAPILRELVDTALSAGRRDVAMSALARLLDEPLEADERGVLRHAHYRLLSSELVDTKSADDSLSRSLESAESAAWAAEEARVRAIESDDGALRVKAHRRLASDAKDPAVRTAHLATAARAAALADDAQTAISLLREALETAGSHPYLSNLLAVLLERQGDSAEAVRVLRNAAPASASAADTEHTLLRAARTAERAGQLEAARASYRDCVGAHPGSVGASWMLGRFAERTHDGDAALLAHESLARAEVDAGVPGVETLLLGEHLAFGREEPALAVDALRAVLDADDTAPHAALALALLDVGALEPDMRDATARGLVAAASAAALPGVLRYAAREARDGATTEQRETLARAARELDPQEAWPGLAELLGPGEPDPRTFQRLAATEDEGIAADFRLAGERLLALRGTPPDTTSTALDAIDSFTHACLVLESRTGATPEMEAAALAFVRDATHVSGQRDVDHALARAHLAAGDTARALDAARRLTLEDPSDMAAWDTVLSSARAEGAWADFVHASDALGGALEGPERADLLGGAAQVLIDELNDGDGAERRLRAALEADPMHANAYALLRDLFVQRGQAQALLALVRQRITRIDDAEELEALYYEQARLARSVGELSGALAALDELALLAPSHLGALALRIEILVALERWADAVNAFRDLSASNAPVAQRRLARIGAADFLEQKLHDPAGAIRELEAILTLGAADAGIFERLGGITMRQGDTVRAREHFENAAQMSRGSDRARCERKLAELLEREGATGEAVDVYERALEHDPRDLDSVRGVLALSGDAARRARIQEATDARLVRDLEVRVVDADALRRLGEFAALTGDALRLKHVRSLSEALSLPWEGPEDVATARTQAKPVATTAALDVMAARPNRHLIATARACEDLWLELDEGLLQSDGGHEPDASVRDALVTLSQRFDLPKLGVASAGPGNGIALIRAARGKVRWAVGRGVTTPFEESRLFVAAELCAAHRLGVLPLVSRSAEDAARLLSATFEAAGGEPLEGFRAAAPLVAAIRQRMGRKVRRAVLDAHAAVANGGTDLIIQFLDDVVSDAVVVGACVCGSAAPALRAVLRAEPSPERVHASRMARAVVRRWLSEPAIVFTRAWERP